jgi:hypothetical protein
MEEKQITERMYQGNDPGLDWECIEIFEQEGTEWYLYRNEKTSAEWQNMKLAAQGKVTRKANYWFGWNGKRANNSRDWMTLGGHRAELQQAVLGYLKQT